MSKEERRNQKAQQSEEKDVKSQYCNSNHCQYDCTTGSTNHCNASFTGAL